MTHIDMTHFLFLEKGAQLRDGQRVQREKAPRDRSTSRARRSEETAAPGPAFLFLMVPNGDGYRVLRAALDEVVEIPASDLDRHDPGKGPAQLLERLLGSNHSAGLLGRLDPSPGHVAAVASGAGARPSNERFGDVEIDLAARVVMRRGEVIALAPMEFDLLVALARRNGAAASRRELLREVWVTTRAVSLRTIDTHVSNLRRKIEDDAAHPRHILTVKKVGYRLKR